MQTQASPRIAFDDVGDGDLALLFLPGWCANRTVFRGLLPLAARHRRAVALDWRGHGGSARPGGDYTTTDLADDALAVAEQAGVRTVVPVGLSHAGWVAIELRRRLGPARVPGIVLLDWMFLGPPPPFLEALAALQDQVRWQTVRSQLFATWTTGVDLPALDAHIAEMAGYGFDTWARSGREIAAQFAAGQSPARALERLDPPCPTLHIYAQPADDAVLAAQQAYARSHPWFQVQRLAAASHFPMFEVPGDLTAAIEDFTNGLSRHGPSSPAHERSDLRVGY